MFNFFRPILLAFLSSIFLSLLTLSSSLKTYNSTNKLNSLEIVLIASASAIALIVLLALILRLIYNRKYGRSSNIQVLERKEITTFTNIGTSLTYHNIVKATEDSNAQNLIVSGEFSATYIAQLSQGVTVAVKILEVGNVHSVQPFHAEIKILGGIRHPNLVTLIGYHASETEMFLIYDYLPGGSLEELIQAKNTRPLCWKVLYKVALDVAEVLVYLHDARIIHRDVKPSNVLLDNDLNGYLSGFGLSRLVENEEVSENSDDVYGYGVVLLELISDKRASLDGFNIVSWACLLLRQGRGNEVFSSGLWVSGPRDDLMEVLNMAVKCTLETLSDRPPMKDVVRQLKQLGQPVS